MLAWTAGCSASAASRARDEAVARAARLGHPEIEYREIWSPGTALALGLLPFGGGGFYVRDKYLAASGFLWPFSMIWVPPKAHAEAIELNDRDFELRLMGALEHHEAPAESENE